MEYNYLFMFNRLGSTSSIVSLDNKRCVKIPTSLADGMFNFESSINKVSAGFKVALANTNS